MKPKPLGTEVEYRKALRRVERLAGALLGTAKAEEFDGWVREIEAYEERCGHRPASDGHDPEPSEPG